MSTGTSRPATQKVLALTGLRLAQLDVIEPNEAFASQGLADSLRAARQLLTPADWAQLDAAFQSNRDTLTGKHPVEAAYEALFSRIAHLA